MSDLETLLVLCVVGVIARKVIDTSKEWAAEEKFKSKEHQQLMDAWDEQAKKYDFYFNRYESKGVLLPDRTRHYDGTPRYKSEDE